MKIIEKPTLPKEVFAVDAAPQLLAQAVRVYLANQRQGNQNAKTRAEINRTRHKLYKQKGTGGARHGDRKAPIFVGGGITFAPKPRDYSLSMSGPLKRRALFGALTAQDRAKKLNIVSGGDKLTGKTSELAKFLSGLEGNEKNTLLITDIVRDNVYRAAKNIPGITVTPANQINTYEVLKAGQILLMEEAIPLINSTTRHSGEERRDDSRISKPITKSDSGRGQNDKKKVAAKTVKKSVKKTK